MARRTGSALVALALLCPGAAWADTLLDNVDGITIDAAGNAERITGIVIGNDGGIAQVLHRGERAGRTDFRIDGKGRVLLPGLVDGHAGVMALGFAALTLDLGPAKSLAEAQGRIAAYLAAYPDRPWVLGRGWDAARWGAVPTAADLDGVAKDRPVWLVNADGHSGWANSAALAAAGITAATKAPPGGEIERTAAGKPSGVLREAAMGLVEKAVPAPRPEDRDLAFAAAQEALLKRGITTVTDMGTTIEDWQALRRAGDSGRLQVRVIGYAGGTDAMSLIGGPGPSPWLYEDRLKLNGVVLTLDGASGVPRLSPIQLRNLMSRAGIDRFQVAVEAHGAPAVSTALDAVSELAQTYRGERRWRIEGGEGTAPQDVARFGGDVAAVLPPSGGPARALAAAGVKVATGSGTPNGAGAPFPAMAAVVTRADEQNVSREQALAAWTSGSAWAGWAETKVGRLAVGLRADFILVDRDPLMAGIDELAATRVLETWVGGRKVWATPAP